MPDYVLQQGDCLTSIAEQHGFRDWRHIYNDARNAEFRKKRPNPNVAFPGDRLFIPDFQEKEEKIASGRRHEFQLNAERVRLRVALRDSHNQPYVGKRFRLVADGKTVEGLTDSQGMVERPIRAGLAKAELTFWPEDPELPPGPIVWTLQLGFLDPVDETQGAQARLNNLGYRCGRVDGDLGLKTEAALKHYQDEHGLQVTGELDTATRDSLCECHDGV